MLILLVGIILLLGAHILTTFRVFRAGLIAQVGFTAYRIVYSLVALTGLALIAWGFGHYRAEAWLQLWTPPTWTRHVALLLMWFAFVAIAFSAPRPSRIRGWLRHPMLVSVKIWALAHLLANGDAGGLLLFGSFLAWAVYDRIAVGKRGDAGAPPHPSFTRTDAIGVAAGTVAYVAMLFLHPVLIGVAVIGR